MGTLFDQRPRQDTLDGYMSSIRRAARKMFGDTDTHTPAQWHAACDVVRTATIIQSADALDEQLAGFGEILRELCSAITEYAEQIGNIATAIDGCSENLRSDHPLQGQTFEGLESALGDVATAIEGFGGLENALGEVATAIESLKAPE